VDRASTGAAPQGVEHRPHWVRVGPDQEPVDDARCRDLAGAGVRERDRAVGIGDDEWIRADLPAPERVVLGAQDARPVPFELGELRRACAHDLEPGRGIGRGAVALEQEDRPQRRHSDPHVGGQRARVVRRERGPARRIAEHRRQQRTPDAPAEDIGPDEQVGEVQRHAGVDGRAVRDHLAVELAHERAVVVDDVADVRPDDVAVHDGVVVAVGGEDRPDRRDVVGRGSPDRGGADGLGRGHGQASARALGPRP
jgi:hypothetical protein